MGNGLERFQFKDCCTADPSVLLGGGLNGQSFTDNFNRPNGPVGNGWGTFNGSTLVNGTVQTFGSGGAGGGIYRSFPVTLPVTFAFDFAGSGEPTSCDTSGLPGGGWNIALNDPGGGFFVGPSYQFFQYHGSGPILRQFLTSAGSTDDSVASGMSDYGTSFVHISGTINADFSATITVAGITHQFGPVANAMPVSTGSTLVLGNSSCGGGPYFFDNFSIQLGGCPYVLNQVCVGNPFAPYVSLNQAPPTLDMPTVLNSPPATSLAADGESPSSWSTSPCRRSR